MLNLTLRDSDSGDVAVRQMLFGLSPMLLIEPKVVPGDDGEDSVELNIDCTDLSLSGIAEMCEFIAEAIREGEVTDVEATPDE